MRLNITNLHARQILDSRGNPTIEVDATLSDGSFGRAAVPSGASTGSREAVELRDGGASYGGKSVQKAVANVNQTIREAFSSVDPLDQSLIDQTLIELDGSDNKSALGANAILGVSLAVAKAAAASKGLAFYQYVAQLADNQTMSLPMPMMNVLNGGQHALGSSDFQEYMIIPCRAKTIAEAIEIGASIFHALSKILHRHGFQTTVGDEGGYAPATKGGNRQPLEFIREATEAAGYSLGEDVVIALDVAASEFYRQNKYHLATENLELDSEQMIDKLADLAAEYNIVSIEDGLDENDWPAWQQLTTRLGNKIQLVGDDLLVTNPETLEQAIAKKAANAILIKPNQIGTLTETIKAVQLAQKNGWNTIISHRSGETEDTTIAHLAVGLGAGQIKTGSLSRSERTAKYNELLRIAEANPKLKLNNPFK